MKQKQLQTIRAVNYFKQKSNYFKPEFDYFKLEFPRRLK